MKKIFMLALAAMTLTVVSCKKDEAAAGKDTTEKKAGSIEEQVEAKGKEIMNALKSGDKAKYKELKGEFRDWVDGLSPEEKEKAEEAIEAYETAHRAEFEEAYDKVYSPSRGK